MRARRAAAAAAAAGTLLVLGSGMASGAGPGGLLRKALGAGAACGALGALVALAWPRPSPESGGGAPGARSGDSAVAPPPATG